MKRLLLLPVLLLLLPPNPALAVTAASFADLRAQTTAVIANGTTTTPEIDLGGTEIVGIQMPAAFTGTTVTFLAATATGGTYQAVTDGTGSNISKTVAASKYIAIDPTLFRGIRYVEIVSGASEGGARTLTVFSIPAK